MRAWILERYQVYGRVCLMTIVFLSPLVFYRQTLDNFNLVKITVTWILAVIALATWLMWSAERRIWLPRFPLLYAAIAFLIAFALATAFSQNHAVSLIGIHQRYWGLIPHLLYVAITITIVGLYWERPEDLKEIARAWAAASILMMVYVIIQAAGLDWIPWKTPGGGIPPFPVGTMGNSNFAGAYLGMAAPFLLYVTLAAESNAAKTLRGLLAGLNLLALWFTQTRGGMVAAAAGLSVMAFVYRDRLPRWAKAGVTAGIVAGAVVAALLLFHAGSSRSPESVVGGETFSGETFAIRIHYWGTALRIFRHNPVLGTGPETYYSNYPPNRARIDGARAGFAIPDKPHNVFLEYAADTGVIGLGSYLVLVGLGCWYAYRRARRLEGHERLLTTAFLAGLIGYLAQAAFSIDVVPLALTGWIALGGVAALADPKIVAERERQRVAEQLKRRPGSKKPKRSLPESKNAHLSGLARWPVHVVTALAAAGLLLVGVRPFAADHSAAVEVGRQASRNSPSGKVAAGFEQAIKLNPLEPNYYRLKGGFAEKRAIDASDPAGKVYWFAEAISSYREAFRLLTSDIYLRDIARVDAAWAKIDPKRFADADQTWAQLAAYDPTNWEVHKKYAEMLNSWADALGGDPSLHQRAAKQLEEVTRLRPGE